jgi:hypothetical protein
LREIGKTPSPHVSGKHPRASPRSGRTRSGR